MQMHFFIGRQSPETWNTPTLCVFPETVAWCDGGRGRGGCPWRWSCSSLGAKWKLVFEWCSVCRRSISWEMKRPRQESQPKLNLLTHVPLSSSLAARETSVVFPHHTQKECSICCSRVWCQNQAQAGVAVSLLVALDVKNCKLEGKNNKTHVLLGTLDPTFS